MNTKHTPGPWMLADENNQCCSVLLSTEHNLTACLDRQDLNTGEFLIERSEMLANARLISAAPELLEALKQCLGMLEQADCSTWYCCCGSPMDGHGIGDGHGPVDQGSYYQCNAMDAARSAIAKATGETE